MQLMFPPTVPAGKTRAYEFAVVPPPAVQFGNAGLGNAQATTPPDTVFGWVLSVMVFGPGAAHEPLIAAPPETKIGHVVGVDVTLNV